MAHGYRTFQHWNQWLTNHFLGNSLLSAEQTLLSHLLNTHYGKHALLLGVPKQYDLLKSTSISYHTLVSPLIHHHKDSQKNIIENDFHELPILTGSIDLVMLPHTLELVDNARQLLAEACRIIKPEGLIVICGFNPYSAWGIKKLLEKNKTAPWSSNFIHSYQVKRWLQLADFVLENQSALLFRPPLSNQAFYEKIKFLEGFGNKFFPFFCGEYILVARAKVIPLTPIRLQWKQQLSGIRISTSIPGHIARQSK